MGAPKGHKPYPGCETGGRPKKFTDEFIENEADALILWMKKPDSLWYKDFAIERGYLSDKFADFSRENEKFRRAFELSKEWQESKLVKGGLTSVYNPGFTKFVMVNTCKWKEKPEEQSVTTNTYYVNYDNKTDPKSVLPENLPASNT